MSFKIWLTAKATEHPAGGQTSSQPAEKPKLYGNTVETSKESGGRYITMYLDPIDPAIDMPRFAREHIKAIAYSDKYHEGFRPEGIYRHKGGKALVRTVVKVETPNWNSTQDVTSVERYQEISISTRSIKTLREIYTKIRQGKLDPVETWSNGGPAGAPILQDSSM